jgi:hypothetical protein
MQNDQNLYIFLPVEIVIGLLLLLGLTLLGHWSRLGQFRGPDEVLEVLEVLLVTEAGCLDYLAAMKSDGFGHLGHRWDAVVGGGIRTIGNVVTDKFTECA